MYVHKLNDDNLSVIVFNIWFCVGGQSMVRADTERRKSYLK